MRVLFITATRIGDAVLSSGVLNHLIRIHPDARFTVACGPLAAPLFRAAPRVDAVIVMRKKKAGGHWIDLWRATVSQRWDLVVDLRGSLISRLLRARKRAVKRKERESVVRHKVVEAAAVLGLESPPDTTVWLDEPARVRAEVELGSYPSVLALSASASWVFKEWAPERFSELARRLTALDGSLPGACIALFGGPGDETTAAKVIQGLDGRAVVDLTGKLDLVEAAACLQRARLFVGNDSGLMHIAAAAQTPTLGLFGPTDERLYAPWGEGTQIIRAGDRFKDHERAALAASQTQSLMGTLKVAAVETAAKTLLAGTAWTFDSERTARA